MIAKLKGIVDSLYEESLILDVQGVGYLVFCSSKTLSRLVMGQACALSIETHVREDHIHLYGFWDQGEKDFFKLLTTVQGVGAKVALAILSVCSSDQIVQSILAGDKTFLTRANGVGPKLAVRIVTELKDKVSSVALAEVDFQKTTSPNAALSIPAEKTILADAVSALENLGYARLQAYQAVNSVLVKQENLDFSEVIRLSLRELAS